MRAPAAHHDTMTRPYAPLTHETANAVYDILVETVHAPDYWRGDFVHHQTDRLCEQHRIIGGALGMGGKFERNTGFRRYGDGSWGEYWYVTAYAEDITPTRREMIETANARLEEIRRRDAED